MRCLALVGVLLVVTLAGCAEDPPAPVALRPQTAPAFHNPPSSAAQAVQGVQSVPGPTAAVPGSVQDPAEVAAGNQADKTAYAFGTKTQSLHLGHNGPFTIDAAHPLRFEFGPDVPTEITYELGYSGDYSAAGHGPPMVHYYRSCRLYLGVATTGSARIWLNLTAQVGQQLFIPPLEEPEPAATTGPAGDSSSSSSSGGGRASSKSNWTGHDFTGSGQETPLYGEQDGAIQANRSVGFYFDVPEAQRVVLVAGTSAPIEARFVGLGNHEVEGSTANVTIDEAHHSYMVAKFLQPGRYMFQLVSLDPHATTTYAVGFLRQ